MKSQTNSRAFTLRFAALFWSIMRLHEIVSNNAAQILLIRTYLHDNYKLIHR